MSRQVFVTDTHIGHASILLPRMQNPRPFASIEAQEETLIANWNAVVWPGDTVWHIGDFCYRCSAEHARSVFDRLQGSQRLLVRGNYDRIGARLPCDGVLDVARVVDPEDVVAARATITSQ